MPFSHFVFSTIIPLDFALAIGSTCARIKFSANTITRSEWCSRRSATIQCSSVTSPMSHRYRRRTEKRPEAAEVSRRLWAAQDPRTVAAAKCNRHRARPCWAWNRPHIITNSSNSNRSPRPSFHTTITTTITTAHMGHRMEAAAECRPTHSMRRWWRFRTAPRSQENDETIDA